MKIIQIKTVVFLFALMAGASVRAAVIVDNLNLPTDDYYGPIGDDANTNDFLIGQEFSLPSAASPYQLSKITLLLSPTGGGGNVTVSVWNAGADNNPTNEIAVVSSQSVVTAGNVDFTPTNNITLPPGSYYVVAAPTTPADNGLVSWAYTAYYTNWTGSGILGGFADTSSGVWENSSITNYPQQLSVEAAPVSVTIAINQQAGVTTLSWPSTLNGYVAETATNLSSPVWQEITNVPTLVAGNNTVTNNWMEPARFFRLRQSYAVYNLDQPISDDFGPIGDDANANDFLIGQEFTLPAGNYNLNKITLPLNPLNGNGSVTISIWNVGPDNNPTNEIAVVSSQLVTNVGNVDFVPSAPITLPSGSYYVVAAPTTSADSAMVSWAYTTSPIWTGFGTLGAYADTQPGGWENFPISAFPQIMSVQVTPSPP